MKKNELSKIFEQVINDLEIEKKDMLNEMALLRGEGEPRTTLTSSLRKYGARAGGGNFNAGPFLSFPYDIKALRKIIKSLLDNQHSESAVNTSFSKEFWDNAKILSKKGQKIPPSYTNLRDLYYANKYPDVPENYRPPFTKQKLKNLNTELDTGKITYQEYVDLIKFVSDPGPASFKESYVPAANAQMLPFMDEDKIKIIANKYIQAFNSFNELSIEYNNIKNQDDLDENIKKAKLSNILNEKKNLVNLFFTKGITYSPSLIKREIDKIKTLLNKIESGEKVKFEENTLRKRLTELQKQQDISQGGEIDIENPLVESNMKYLFANFGGATRAEIYELLTLKSREGYKKIDALQKQLTKLSSENPSKENLDKIKAIKTQINDIKQGITAARSRIKKEISGVYDNYKDLYTYLISKYNPITAKLLLSSIIAISPKLKLDEIIRNDYYKEANQSQEDIDSGFDTNYFEIFHLLDEVRSIETGNDLSLEDLKTITGIESDKESSLREIYSEILKDDKSKDKTVVEKVCNYKIKKLKQYLEDETKLNKLVESYINKRASILKENFDYIIGNIQETFSSVPEEINAFGAYTNKYSFIRGLENYRNKVINNSKTIEALKTQLKSYVSKTNIERINSQIIALMNKKESLKNSNIVKENFNNLDDILYEGSNSLDKIDTAGNTDISKQNQFNIIKDSNIKNAALMKKEELDKRINIIRLIKDMYTTYKNMFVKKKEDGSIERNDKGAIEYWIDNEIKSDTYFEGIPYSIYKDGENNPGKGKSYIEEEDLVKLKEAVLSFGTGIRRGINASLEASSGGSPVLSDADIDSYSTDLTSSIELGAILGRKGAITDEQKEILNLTREYIKDQGNVNELSVFDDFVSKLTQSKTAKLKGASSKEFDDSFSSTFGKYVKKIISDKIKKGEIDYVDQSILSDVSKSLHDLKNITYKGAKVRKNSELMQMSKLLEKALYKSNKDQAEIDNELSRYLEFDNKGQTVRSALSLKDVFENWYKQGIETPYHLLDYPKFSVLDKIFKDFMDNFVVLKEIKNSNLPEEELDKINLMLENTKKDIIEFYNKEKYDVPSGIVLDLNSEGSYSNKDISKKISDIREDAIKLNTYFHSTAMFIGNSLLLEVANYITEFFGIGGIKGLKGKYSKSEEEKTEYEDLANLKPEVPDGNNIKETFSHNVFSNKEIKKDSLVDFLERI